MLPGLWLATGREESENSQVPPEPCGCSPGDPCSSSGRAIAAPPKPGPLYPNATRREAGRMNLLNGQLSCLAYTLISRGFSVLAHNSAVASPWLASRPTKATANAPGVVRDWDDDFETGASLRNDRATRMGNATAARSVRRHSQLASCGRFGRSRSCGGSEVPNHSRQGGVGTSEPKPHEQHCHPSVPLEPEVRNRARGTGSANFRFKRDTKHSPRLSQATAAAQRKS